MMLVDAITVGPIRTNCYLFGDTEKGVCAIVDPGDEPEKVLKMVEKNGNLNISCILLTHGHFDHRDGVEPLKALAGEEIPVYLHKCDHAEDGISHRYQYGGAVRYYDEGDTVSVGDLTLKVLYTPGHTAGCVSLLGDGVLFAGDTLFAGTCGRCDLPSSSFEEMLSSLKRLSALPDDTKVYPGHGHSSTIGMEKRTNPYVMQAMAQ